MIIDEYWWLLMIVDDYWWFLMIIDDYWWLLMIIDDYWWLLMIIDDYWLLLIIIDDYWWLLMIIDDYWWLLMIIDAYWCILIALRTYIRRFMDPVFLSSSRPPSRHDSTTPALFSASHIQRPRGHIQIQVDVEEASSAKLSNSKGGPFFRVFWWRTRDLAIVNHGCAPFMAVLVNKKQNWNWICEWIYQHFTVKNEDQIYIYIYTNTYYIHVHIYIYITHCTLYIYTYIYICI